MSFFGGLGGLPQMIAHPLNKYHRCTGCTSLRGWVMIIAKPTGPEDLLARLEDEKRTILCTRCATGKVADLGKQTEPSIIPFWEYLEDEGFVIEELKIEAKEPMEDRGLSPYDFGVTINGEFVNRLERLDLTVWIGEPGYTLRLVFGLHEFDEEGALKEIKKVERHIGKDRIRGLKFDLLKTDDSDVSE